MYELFSDEFRVVWAWYEKKGKMWHSYKHVGKVVKKSKNGPTFIKYLKASMKGNFFDKIS